MALQFRPLLAPALDVQATAMEQTSPPSWDLLAAKYWQKAKPTRLKPDALKSEFWDPLEHEGFSPRALSQLDSLQFLEHFLWPTFTEDSSDQHVLLITTFFNLRQRAGLQSWSLFAAQTDNFAVYFRRLLSLGLDPSLPDSSKLSALEFVIGAFQSLEQEFVRKECAPLVSISVWYSIHSTEVREQYVEESVSRKKAWRGLQKRFEAASPEAQARLKFERSWLYSMLLDFLTRINADMTTSAGLVYCEKFLEFLIDLVSQLPTRRYTNILIKDLNVLPIIVRSKGYSKHDHGLLRDLTSLFEHFQTFAIDDAEAIESSYDSLRVRHHHALARLQRVAMQHFEEKLKILALSNYSSIDKRTELEQSLAGLSDQDLESFCQLLGFRTTYPPSCSVPESRGLWLEVLLRAYSRPQDFREHVSSMRTSPTESTIYDSMALQADVYDGTRPLPVPKLNLQYLTASDFMWRSFQLYQAETVYGIRQDLESVVRRMQPRLGREKDTVTFGGFSKMALPVDKPAIVEIAPPQVGKTYPGFVRSEVLLDVSRLTESMRFEWDNLRPRDAVFLLTVRPPLQGNGSLTNGTTAHDPAVESGLLKVRTAEVVQVLDENSRPLREHATTNGYGPRPRRRRLLLDLDPVAFQADNEKSSTGKDDVYGNVNVIARRQGRGNNFKAVLETIQSLVGSQTALPDWLQEVYLGYGNPRSASFTYMEDKVDSVDYLDTFLDWEHLKASFPYDTLEAVEGQSDAVAPPYILQSPSGSDAIPPSNPKKRRREQMEDGEDKQGPIRVKTYQPKSTGPYPVDVPKKNVVRFTPKQVEAISSGAQPGLSVVVGPPGTGKTDVATQIINLLYHNFSDERILLVAHSNQALNQLFQKIIALDIDPRHLLRLGHGEEELDTEASYGKYGRVESFLENRQHYLAEVTRLAGSVGAEGAHGSTCETADYFDQVYIKPAWTRFWDLANSDSATPQMVIDGFPFYSYFSNAPVAELFPRTSSLDEARTVASGCEYHLRHIFTELAAIRPFEVLRSQRDQANHLLVSSARIIAMTSTHAAMRRSEIADLGFRYSTLVMEEAAQITEIESFIPMAMQNPDPQSSAHGLKRIVLIGDHLQNSPIIQNIALRQYAHFDQSLFQRLVRLGVPTITLDAQGRCRPSIADLFSWRYPQLTSLPDLLTNPTFARANAGFKHDYQFLSVPDYNVQGEREPTPHFFQNLGEAEFAVALYQYMRLLGYPSKSITILATYAGQRSLIHDVLSHRCKNNRLFGMPGKVSTVDRYQGEQNEYIILSLTRTKSVGFMRDVRRLTVALSRARLGLYVLGRKELWNACAEMAPAMALFDARPEKLEIVTGEMYPTTRQVHEDVKGVVMEGVEHLGQYVYEMTQAKVRSMGGDVVLEERAEEENATLVEEDEAMEEVEEDPLHESVT